MPQAIAVNELYAHAMLFCNGCVHQWTSDCALLGLPVFVRSDTVWFKPVKPKHLT
jgi:hypothetical protein